jgi:hypothetical protein
VKTLRWGLVIALIRFAVFFGQEQDLGGGLGGKHGLFEQKIRSTSPRIAIPEGFRFHTFGKTAVSGIVKIKARHFTEAHNGIIAFVAGAPANLPGHCQAAFVVAERLELEHGHVQIGRDFPLPVGSEHVHLMASFEACFGDSHKIPLQSAKRKIFDEGEGKFH